MSLTPAIKNSLFLLIGVVFVLIITPTLFPKSYYEPTGLTYAPPSWQHPCGTDLNGRDLLYRILTGGQISILIGCCGAFISLFVGTTYGMIAGYRGGFLDSGMTRFIDILYSIPRLIFVLIFINAFNEHLQKTAHHFGYSWIVSSSRIIILILSLGLIEWLTMARIVRGQTLSLKERPYILAARVLGQNHLTILWRHLLPNLTGILLVYMTLSIPAVIIDEAFLSFLGLGVQAPQASLGSLLAEGASALNPLHSAWWTLLFPALLLFCILLLLHQLGNALRKIRLYPHVSY
ncbi:MAG: ABC transporter permease [Verrucomicrobia bacterium]|nr:MAG: ABC transporter permease [Verrucomicrobiota bacterium]